MELIKNKEWYDKLMEYLDAGYSPAEIAKKLNVSEDVLKERMEYIRKVNRKMDKAVKAWKGSETNKKTVYKSVRITEDVKNELENIIKVDLETHEELGEQGKAADSYNKVIKGILKTNRLLMKENEKLKRQSK